MEDFETPDIVKINFGKYKGWTIREIYEYDEGYLQWFYHNIDGNDGIKNQICNLYNGDVPEDYRYDDEIISLCGYGADNMF
jgi:hypothetical protein